MSLVLGIDSSTTATKAILVDEEGTVVSVASLMAMTATSGRSRFAGFSAASMASASSRGTGGASVSAVAAGRLAIQPPKPTRQRTTSTKTPEKRWTFDMRALLRHQRRCLSTPAFPQRFQGNTRGRGPWQE